MRAIREPARRLHGATMVFCASALSIAALTVCATADTAAAAQPTVEMSEAGIYETGPPQRVPLRESVSGEMNLVSSVRLIRPARVLAAYPGRSFGWRYRYRGLPPGATVTLRTLHPPLTNPETGATMTRSQREVRIDNPERLRYTGYTFDYMWEMAEGMWRFQVLYRGRVIGERRFKVLVPLN